MTHVPDSNQAPVPPPWWKFGYVWLVISGPAAVALAAIATVWLALAYPETLVAEDYYRRGADINKTLAEGQGQGQGQALVPALQGRNHAVTPAQPGTPGPR